LKFSEDTLATDIFFLGLPLPPPPALTVEVLDGDQDKDQYYPCKHTTAMKTQPTLQPKQKFAIIDILR